MCNIESNVDNLMELNEFIKNFNIHYKLLLRRYERFKEINDIHNRDIDVITYLDIIVVQLRAMCIESKNYKKNYTAQILLRKTGRNEAADRLDLLLEEVFIPSTDFTIRIAIKTLADGFICHYDNFDGPQKDKLSLAEIIEKKLRNPYDEKNLDYIMNTLISCIGSSI